jgi:biopolymer transport protein ExbB
VSITERLLRLPQFASPSVLWLLVLLSIAALAVILERAVLFVTSRDDATRLRFELRRLLRDNDLELARRRLEESPSFEARVAAAGLSADSLGSAQERMQGESEVCRLSMEQNLALLAALARHAPLIGVLGTVIGIVRALCELRGAGAEAWVGLSAQLGEALLPTATGLLVALLAAPARDLFQRVIVARMGRASALSHEVMAFLKSPAASAAE